MTNRAPADLADAPGDPAADDASSQEPEDVGPEDVEPEDVEPDERSRPRFPRRRVRLPRLSPVARGYLARSVVMLVALALLGLGVYGIRTLQDPQTIQTLAGGYQVQLPPDAPVQVPEVRPEELLQQPGAAVVPDAGPAAPGAAGAAPTIAGNGRQEVFAGWASRLAARLDIPERSLQAYAYAHAAIQQTQPGCRLTWVTLAGIARIESNHGRFGGAVVGPDGRPSKPIIGVPLDGTGGNRAIGDSDGGRLDGDTSLDRAVGPFQFIPTTWASWASDGDGDGRGDPQDIDDSAVAAGRYLCANSRDLSTGADWSRAILSYNNSQAYVRNVFAGADRYARESVV